MVTPEAAAKDKTLLNKVDPGDIIRYQDVQGVVNLTLHKKV
jgi:hypothetical protein